MTIAPATAPARSTFVTVVGLLFAILGGLSVLGAVLQNVVFATILAKPEMQQMMKQFEGPGYPWYTAFMFEHLQLLLLGFLVAATCCLVGAIGLLLRKNWGRVLFIGVMAIAIAWNLLGLVTAVALFSALPDYLTRFFPRGGKVPPVLDVFWKAVNGVNALLAIAFMVLFAWIIQRLTSPRIRSEFGAAGAH